MLHRDEILGEGKFLSTPSTLVTCGLQHLYEGTTICHASVLGNLQTIARSTQGNPIILIHDQKEKDRGRVVVDTGFTKLWTEWKLTGNERYICNATVWLLGIDLLRVVTIKN